MVDMATLSNAIGFYVIFLIVDVISEHHLGSHPQRSSEYLCYPRNVFRIQEIFDNYSLAVLIANVGTCCIEGQHACGKQEYIHQLQLKKRVNAGQVCRPGSHSNNRLALLDTRSLRN
jgi:hypothetical protein